MAYQIFQLPKSVLFSAGVLQPGWSVEFFLTTTTTPTPVYTTSALSTTHTQPVEADAAGIMPVIYLDPTIVYKASVYDALGALAYTIDPVNDNLLSQAIIGALLYPRTAAEIAAGVTPTNYAYPFGDLRRYGLPVDGVSSCTAALNTAISVANVFDDFITFRFPRGTFVFATRPSDIIAPMRFVGEGRNNTYLIRDYTPASADIGLLNFKASVGVSASTGSSVERVLIATASGETGGCLISMINPATGDGPDYCTLRDVRLTNSQGIGGTGNGPDYLLYVDGSARSSPPNIRNTWLSDSIIFGGALGSVFLKCVNGFHATATDFLSAGSVSGKVIYKGISGQLNTNGVFTGCTFADIDIDYAENLLVTSQLSVGTVTQVAANITGLKIIAPQSETVFEKTGGNLLTGRYNPSNYRAGLYNAGTSGAAFLGGNLDWASGNIFNYDKTSVAWWIGDPTGSGECKIGCKSGTAGNSAGVDDLASQALRITADGNIFPGRASSQSMADGFFYIPSAGGAPSGAPTAISGYAPMYVDTTNHKLYFYSGGSWRDAGP